MKHFSSYLGTEQCRESSTETSNQNWFCGCTLVLCCLVPRLPYLNSSSFVSVHNISRKWKSGTVLLLLCIIVNVNERVKAEEAWGTRLLFAGGRDGELVDWHVVNDTSNSCSRQDPSSVQYGFRGSSLPFLLPSFLSSLCPVLPFSLSTLLLCSLQSINQSTLVSYPNHTDYASES